MGISHIASKRESCPAPLLAENTIEDIFQIFFSPPKGIQATASMCMLLSAKLVPPFFLVSSSCCCSSSQTKL